MYSTYRPWILRLSNLVCGNRDYSWPCQNTQVLFPLILLCGSSPLRKCPHIPVFIEYSAEYSEGTLCRSLGSLSVLFSPLLCSVNSSCLSLPKLFSNIYHSLPGFPLPCTTAQRLSQGSRLSNHKAHPCFHLSGISLFDVQCLKNCCFTNSVHFLIVMGRRVNPIPVTPSWLEV